VTVQWGMKKVYLRLRLKGFLTPALMGLAILVGSKHGAEQVVNLLRQIEVAIANGKTTVVAPRKRRSRSRRTTVGWAAMSRLSGLCPDPEKASGSSKCPVIVLIGRTGPHVLRPRGADPLLH